MGTQHLFRKLKPALMAAIFVFTAANVVPANAVLITASPGGTVVDFSQFGSYLQGTGPVEVGGLIGESIKWSSTNGTAGIVAGNLFTHLADNGSWTPARNGFTTLNPTFATGFYTEFLFNDGPVSVVGAFVNYARCVSLECDPTQHFIIQALGNGGVVLETFDISVLAPINTPGGIDAGAFRGIARQTNDVFAFRLFNAVHVLDDLEFIRVAAPVSAPEPSTLALFATGLITPILARRRRKRPA